MSDRRQLIEWRGAFLVMLAKVGIQVDRIILFWIPAFAGMTVYFADNAPTPQLIKTKKEVKMSGIATILGWAGFITLVGMMIVFFSKKWLR